MNISKLQSLTHLLFSLQTIGKIMIPLHAAVKLPDENDRCFYEYALCPETKILITRNKKHCFISLYIITLRVILFVKITHEQTLIFFLLS